MPPFVVELLQDAHFWVGVAFAILILILLRAGVSGTVVKLLDGQAAGVQAQLDEATRIRKEAESLLASIKDQRRETEAMAGEMLANARAEALRLETEASEKLADQIKRRGELAERKIAAAEAAATAEVKTAAADLAAQVAEQVLAARIAVAKADPSVDAAIKDMAARLQ
jgi:F-type H+-transporting ATPase subunit b